MAAKKKPAPTPPPPPAPKCGHPVQLAGYGVCVLDDGHLGPCDDGTARHNKMVDMTLENENRRNREYVRAGAKRLREIADELDRLACEPVNPHTMIPSALANISLSITDTIVALASLEARARTTDMLRGHRTDP